MSELFSPPTSSISATLKRVQRLPAVLAPLKTDIFPPENGLHCTHSFVIPPSLHPDVTEILLKGRKITSHSSNHRWHAKLAVLDKMSIPEV